MPTLPPLKALHVFSVVSQVLNVTHAAEKLNVTQSAVSQQLKLLEDSLGVQLFKREGKRLELTTLGKQYAAKICIALDEIKQATRSIKVDTRRTHIITVNMLTAFASRWLIPRLIDFQQQYPNYELRISTPVQYVDFSVDEIDAAIHHDVEHCGGNFISSFLFQDNIFPVCSPNVMRSMNITNTLKPSKNDLVGMQLLHVSTDERNPDWPAWLRAAGLPSLSTHKKVMLFSTLDHSLQAAINGLGISMAPESLVQEEIKHGTLVTPWAFSIPAPYVYYLLYPERAETKHEIFSKWLMNQTKI